MTPTRLLPATLCFLLFPAVHGFAQPAGPVDLRSLQEAAVHSDPRYAALQLEAEQANLRLRAIRAERGPAVGVEGRAQYQSDVPTPPPIGPTGALLFSPPKMTYDASVRIEQSLIDPVMGARLAAEEAQLAETQARTRTALFALRQDVNDAFFAAALVQDRLYALAATLEELTVRYREADARKREGTALPLDAASIQVTLLRRQQDQQELQTNRHAALARLAKLTGRSFDDNVVLELPQLTNAVARARQELSSVRSRPEYEQFARTKERLARQQDLLGQQEKPRVSLYARVGYGLPALNFVGDQFDSYGLAGIQVQWKAWNGGASTHERNALVVQQQIVASDEAAFVNALDRGLETDLAAIDRLERALPLDDRIVSLREEIARVTDVRFREGVVTVSEYVDRTTELLDARFARSGHRTELAQAGARLLTTLGLEVR